MATNVVYSIVIPVYNEEGNIQELYSRLTNVMRPCQCEYEIIFVDDMSSDASPALLDSIANHDRRVKIIVFSRNFGHQAAITAGLEHATGKAIIMMDADLQDPPELIPRFIEKHNEGYEVVYGKRISRKGESAFKLLTAFLFYRLMRVLTSVDVPFDAGDFRLIDRRVCDNLSALKEKNRFIRGLITWVGYKQIGVNYERDPRYSGQTHYPLIKMVKFAIDGITTFSHHPLKIATFSGLIISCICCLIIIWGLYLKITGEALPGWTSLLLIVSFLGGLQLLTIGVLGEYIGRIYDEVKNRPTYIVSKLTNYTNENK